MAVHGRVEAIVSNVSRGVAPGSTLLFLGPSVLRTATGAALRIGAITMGSGSPGRFRNSENVTSCFFTSLTLSGEPREGFSTF